MRGRISDPKAVKKHQKQAYSRSGFFSGYSRIRESVVDWNGDQCQSKFCPPFVAHVKLQSQEKSFRCDFPSACTGRSMAEPLQPQHSVADLVPDDTGSSKKRRQSRTYDTPCEGFSRTIEVPEKDRVLFATDIKLAAFKECCKAWMAGPYPGVEVGSLATPWTTGQELRSTCVCCEHTECHSRNGTTFQLRGKNCAI